MQVQDTVTVEPGGPRLAPEPALAARLDYLEDVVAELLSVLKDLVAGEIEFTGRKGAVR
jgi:hypothetical protein